MEAGSDRSVHTHQEVEDVLHADKQLFAIVNVNVELALDRLVNVHAGGDVHVAVLGHPVRLERDGHPVPPVRVDLAQTVPAHADDSLGQHVGLLVQVNVVLVRVVKSTLLDSDDRRRIHSHRDSLRFSKAGQHLKLIINETSNDPDPLAPVCRNLGFRNSIALQ